MQFKLNFGRHRIGKTTYHAGDIVESNVDLASVFGSIVDRTEHRPKFSPVENATPQKPTLRGEKCKAK